MITCYIVSHKYGRYLEEAIQSVLNQTYQDFEIILIDNGSKDETHEIFHSYLKCPKTKKLITNFENLGLIKCCNQALFEASGEWIIRLDGDDFFTEDAFEKMLSVSENKDIVKCGFITIDDADNMMSTHSAIDAQWHGASCLVSKSFLKLIGGYDEEFDCQDGYYLNLQSENNNGQIAYLNQQLFFYRQHGKNLSDNQNKILTTRDRINKKYARKT